MPRKKKIKITNPRMQTQDGPMTRPSGAKDKTAHVLTASEAERLRKKNAKKKKKF